MPYNAAIPGQVMEFQLKAIETVATLVPINGKVVEVGSLFGSSSWAWAKSVDPSVQVYCVDPWEHNSGVRPMEKQYGIKYGIEQFKIYTADCPNIHPMKGYSPQDFTDWNEPIDLYFEDAVHIDPILSDNLAFWGAKLKQAGIMCGDDYRPRFPDVINGAKRYAQQLGRELITVDFFWCLLPDESVLPGAAEVTKRLKALSAQCDAEKRARGLKVSIGPTLPFDKAEVGKNAKIAMRVTNTGIDAWPVTSTGPVEFSARVTSEERPGQIVAQTTISLGVKELPADIPVDFEFELKISGLMPGRYRIIYDVLNANGMNVIHPEIAHLPAPLFEILPSIL